ncbi:MAG: hypothetical protein PHE17_18465 [Thiothrix sp.]|uniref:hypothetical protein n=1 Tax=Thiothrix sp. TaxID=1032 RepID=UPI002615C7A4|nr:hypothetical protein [Thiothrix sp.]MDD5395007.1 hypothetical protein [Thiothrix sp.]
MSGASSIELELLDPDWGGDVAPNGGLDGVVPPLPSKHLPATARATPQPRTVGITADPNPDSSRGVLATCPQGEPPKTQPDWYMPGYHRIGLRLCDGQWVTCGNGYPCAQPTPKDGGAGYGDASGGYGGYGDSTAPAPLTSEGGFDYYAYPKH